MNIKIIRFVSLAVLSAALASCTSITRRIEASGNSQSSYAPATTKDKLLLQGSPSIDLSLYKPVQERPLQRKDMAIAIAASGGGYRAANFTAGVLMGLEEERSPYLPSNLLQSVDYFSTVSGSGFAIGFYEANLYSYWYRYHQSKNAPAFSFNQIMQKVLRSDNGMSLLSRNVLARDYTDLLFFGDNRGKELEENLGKTILKTPDGELTLGDIFIPKNAKRPVVLPYWLANTTIYQNSDMFPISPDILSKYKVRGYWHNQNYYWLTGDFNQSNYASDFPASVGMTASASMPFVFPATTLTSQACTSKSCYLQLLDGGLSDNMGVFSAVNFLYQDPAKIKVLIIVDASNSSEQPFSKSKTPPTGFPLLWQLFNMTTDALRNHIRTYIDFTAKDILCAQKSKNVVVIYLNLADDPAARKIGTSMQISANEQRYLINLGKKMVENNAELKTFLEGLTVNSLNTDRCPIIEERKT